VTALAEPVVSTAMISSDSHVIEPPDLWTDRVDRSVRDRAPRVVTDDDTGEQWWVVGGHRTLSFAGGAQTGDRFVAPEQLRTGARFEQVRPGGYVPADHLVDNEADGVVGAVMYPTEGLLLYTQADSELLSACCRAYNDWLAEFCAAAPDRIKGVAMLNTDDVGEAVRELERAHGLGLAGGLIPTAAPPEQPYDSDVYEPLWAAAAAMGVPLSLHLGANRVGTSGVDPNLARIRPTYFAVCEHWVKVSLADMLFSGVFDRHPALHVGAVEHELGWIPFFLDRLDYTYTQRHGNARYYRLADGAMPSDHFRRNVFCSFQDDELGIRERHHIGLDGLCWGNDYPHTESTFPRSRQIMGARLADVPGDEQRRIVRDNTARLYGFPSTA
jgi:predicted TIM-barrel fold metal-dependent hydrolase